MYREASKDALWRWIHECKSHVMCVPAFLIVFIYSSLCSIMYLFLPHLTCYHTISHMSKCRQTASDIGFTTGHVLPNVNAKMGFAAEITHAIKKSENQHQTLQNSPFFLFYVP